MIRPLASLGSSLIFAVGVVALVLGSAVSLPKSWADEPLTTSGCSNSGCLLYGNPDEMDGCTKYTCANGVDPTCYYYGCFSNNGYCVCQY